MNIQRCCEQFDRLNLTAIAEDCVAVDDVAAVYCPHCGTRLQITVGGGAFEYPIAKVLPRRGKKGG